MNDLKRKNLIFLPSDKGGEFCVIQTEDYNGAAMRHLEKQATYTKVPGMTARTIEKHKAGPELKIRPIIRRHGSNEEDCLAAQPSAPTHLPIPTHTSGEQHATSRQHHQTGSQHNRRIQSAIQTRCASPLHFYPSDAGIEYFEEMCQAFLPQCTRMPYKNACNFLMSLFAKGTLTTYSV